MTEETVPHLSLSKAEGHRRSEMVDEKNGFMTSVLLQHHGDKLQPVAYFSSKLDLVASGLPFCLRAVAAAEQAAMASRDFAPETHFVVRVREKVGGAGVRVRVVRNSPSVKLLLQQSHIQQ
ncbi:hypothetical protein QQF64_026003 [Cirrhinus molitorella]|uniref:Reverse transcriptase/retrotransposon-derived protein RNase H-like domain-containing protein n=1 Tax=Cirrhinus molitorella TaxID=172907 RepID=A0ABR3NQK6_9TELE